MPADVAAVEGEILATSKWMFQNPELGSQEYKTHDYFVSKLRSHGFDVTPKYLGMETAWLGRFGKSHPKVSLWAEFDALPIGHACGHNLATSYAYGVALAVTRSKDFKGEILFFGSPAEENIGPYASSKARIAPLLKELGVDVGFFAHPGGDWEVGGTSLAHTRKSFVFLGKEASASKADEGVNALDAAVQFYIALKMMRSALSTKKMSVLNAVIKDGGLTPKFNIPGRAEVWTEIRTIDVDYAQELFKKVSELASSTAKLSGCQVEESNLMPLVLPWKRAPEIENIYLKHARDYLSNVTPPDVVWARARGGGSADIGNVSQAVPTAELRIKIGRSGLPTHTAEYRDRAGTPEAQEALLTAVAIGYESVMEYVETFGQQRG